MEAVGAPEALESVVAVHAHELVGAVVSPQGVVVGRTGKVLDETEYISFSVATRSTDAKQGGHVLGRLCQHATSRKLADSRAQGARAGAGVGHLKSTP
jgi:hypothetical protein